jgi:hypothetical protein
MLSEIKNVTELVFRIYRLERMLAENNARDTDFRQNVARIAHQTPNIEQFVFDLHASLSNYYATEGFVEPEVISILTTSSNVSDIPTSTTHDNCGC